MPTWNRKEEKKAEAASYVTLRLRITAAGILSSTPSNAYNHLSHYRGKNEPPNIISFIQSELSEPSVVYTLPHIAYFLRHGQSSPLLYPVFSTNSPFRLFVARPHFSFPVQVALHHSPPHRVLTITPRPMPNVSRIRRNHSLQAVTTL